LSKKALRLYERQGLFMPDAVDSTNGYRWYRESRLDTARLIVMLWRIDMPLARIGEVLTVLGSGGAKVTGLSHGVVPKGGESVGTVIAGYWDEVELLIATRRELTRHLESRLLGEELRRDEVDEIHEHDVSEQTVLTEQRHLVASELPEWIEVAMDRLWPIGEWLGGVTGAAFVIYHGEVNDESDGPVEVCLPVSGGSDASDAPLRIECAVAHRTRPSRSLHPHSQGADGVSTNPLGVRCGRGMGHGEQSDLHRFLTRGLFCRFYGRSTGRRSL